MKHEINDIHSHVVPNIDDGASDFNMAIELLRMAHKQGVCNIMCTSHNYGMGKQYFSKLNSLKKQLKKEHININLYPGCEIYCDVDDIADIIAWLNNKQVPTLNQTKYVLIEFYPYAHAYEIVYCIKQLHRHGYKTILAHTERYGCLFKNKKWISMLQRVGCLFQINAYSLVDGANKKIKSNARMLLAEKRVTFIGSDAHRTDHRPYIIKNGVDYIYQNCDKEYAENICYRNARRILNMK